MRPAAKEQKTNTLNSRGCSFGVPLNTRGVLHARHTAKKHTLHTRGCSFEPHWTREGASHARHTQRYKSTYTHWKDVIHYSRMNNYPSHAEVRFDAFRCYVLMHLAAFRVLYFVAACGSSSSSEFGFYCCFLFNSSHDISQSVRKWKHEFTHDFTTELL